ncbi:MAG: histidinol dehydrogenase [Oscillospiraceae bacterium]|nr:histidinol dehydrogenase [Oscillospiraceae bacterium]
MLKIIKADGASERALLASIRSRKAKTGERISAAAEEIMTSVKENGFTAVQDYSLQFDHAHPREIFGEELDAACRSCAPELISSLRRAADNIRTYNLRLLPSGGLWSSPDGGTVGRLVRGMTRVGIYVPGGTAAYPSTVLMNAVPAKVAGVKEIIMATPPTKHLNSAVLAAAKIAGVDRVIAVGGVQAVAALTYGAGFIPQVDKLVGPGNAYVAAAKRLAYGTIDIDMVAGPSEVLIVADEGANPKYAAADLLSQAEHDVMAGSLLLTNSATLAKAVCQEVRRQIAGLDRAAIISQSLEYFGGIIICGNLEQAADLANEIAPEHLEVLTAHPEQLLPKFKNAGAIFLGEYSPEPLGDYIAGPDHVLPTGGTARFFSPLSAESFTKTTSVLAYDRKALASVKNEIVTMASAEGLSAHANSIRVRFDGIERADE